jgi:hypothetical protein
MKSDTKKVAIRLRKMGMSYSDISKHFSYMVPKSTLSLWLSDIILDPELSEKIRVSGAKKLHSTILRSIELRKARRYQYFEQIRSNNANLSKLSNNIDVSKLVLSMLYLAEGSKRKNGSIVFCNSDPYIISLFLHLFRVCYRLDQVKIRCTVQCRADQNVPELEQFWSQITGIPLENFLKAQVDKRTIGIITKKVGYMGVCRIDYYSSHIFHELSEIPKIYFKGP